MSDSTGGTDKFLEKFPVWAVSVQDKKSKATGYYFLKHKSGIEFLPVFTEHDFALLFVKKNKLWAGLAAMDAPKNLVGLLRALKAGKVTHVGFNPRKGGEVDLFSIDEVIEAAGNKDKESDDGTKNGKHHV